MAEQHAPRHGLLSELKRRRVPRALLVYAAVGFAILQAADILFPALRLPEWSLTLLTALLLLGVPMVAVLAWLLELTPEGLRRTTSPGAGGDVHHPWLTGPTVATAVLFLVLGLAGGWFARPRGEPAAATAALDARSIAVLPFANLSGDQRADAFTAGIHDDLLTHLFRIGDLKVISRTSVMEYAGTARNLRTIGEELGVAHVLEGGVQQAGDRVRINVQLIDARTDAHLWAEQYDRELTTENVFAIQNEIAQAIANALRATFSSDARALLERTPTANLAAYDLYARAVTLRPEATGYERTRMEQRIGLLEQAVKLDDTFAEAWADLSQARSSMVWFHYDRTPAMRRAARAAVDRALELGPDLPEAQLALGSYHYFCELDYGAAIEAFERARRGLPGSAMVEFRIASVRRRQGRMEDALRHFVRAQELDPRSNGVARNLAETYQLLRRYDEALTSFDRALVLDPANDDARLTKVAIYLRGLGDVAAARRELAAVSPGAAGTYQYTHFLALAEIYGRRWRDALRVMSTGKEDVYFSQFFYLPRALLSGQALAALGESAAARAQFMAARAQLAPLMQQDGADPRYVSADALALSGLGRHDEAIRTALRATEILPMEKDVWRGSWAQEQLARVYAAAGEHDHAIEVLERLVRAPSEVGEGMLRLDPAWDGIRNLPRFQALLREL